MALDRTTVHTSGMRRTYPIVVAFALAVLALVQHAWGHSCGIEVAINRGCRVGRDGVAMLPSRAGPETI